MLFSIDTCLFLCFCMFLFDVLIAIEFWVDRQTETDTAIESDNMVIVLSYKGTKNSHNNHIAHIIAGGAVLEMTSQPAEKIILAQKREDCFSCFVLWVSHFLLYIVVH